MQIDERHPLEINSSEQWIFTRGNSDGAILLFVHGGPGFPFTTIARSFEAPFKKDYLIVHWDQRGLGKAFKSTDFSHGFSLQQFVQDGLAVAVQIRLMYPSRPIILFAHSWGTVVGAKMVAQAPDLFTAYLSVGTNTDSLEIEKYRYDFLKSKFSINGLSEALKTLKTIGPPPISPQNSNVFAEMIMNHIPFNWTWGPIPRDQVEAAVATCVEAEDYTNRELEDTLLKAMPLSVEKLHNDYISFSAKRDVPQINVPVYFIQGQLDFNTPTIIAKSYYQSLIAPKGKHWIELEGHGHMVMYEAPSAILSVLSEIDLSLK